MSPASRGSCEGSKLVVMEEPAAALGVQETARVEELLDRVLDTGASLWVDLTLSVADVDLAYVSLRALLASVETARGARRLERGGTSVAERAANERRPASEMREAKRETIDGGEGGPAPQALGPAPRRTGMDTLERRIDGLKELARRLTVATMPLRAPSRG